MNTNINFNLENTKMLNLYKYYVQPEDLTSNELSTALDKLKNKNDWGVTVWYKDLKPVEHIIIKDPKSAEDYAQFILGKRWPEAEPIIMTDAQSAFFYAIAFMKERWIEAEPAIKTVPEYWRSYKQEYKIGDE